MRNEHGRGPRTCAYLRRSRDDGRNESLEEVLERQRKIVEAAAADAGVEIAKTFMEVVSGASISERPRMRELLAEVADGRWDVVCVPEISRLSRGDGSDQAIICNALRLTGTKVLCDWRTYDLSRREDLELFETKLQSSRSEYRSITHRLQRGTWSTVKEGYSHGGSTPYGLVRTGRPGHKVYERGPEFENLRLIMDYPERAANPTWSGLQRLLHDMGVASPKGKEWWSITTLRRIYTVDAYYGVATYGATETVSKLGENFEEVRIRQPSEQAFSTKARWERFFDRERVERSLRRMSAGARVKKGCRGLVNPLAGLLRCGKCGRAMELAPATSTSGGPSWRHPYIRGGCSCKSVAAGKLMKALLEALRADVESFAIEDARAAEEGRRSDLTAAAKRYREEAAGARAARLSAYDRLDRKVIDEELFDQIDRRERERAEAAEEAAKEAERQLATLPSAEEAQRSAIKTDAVLELLETERLSPADMNAALKQIISRIDYANAAERHSHADAVELTVHMS